MGGGLLQLVAYGAQDVYLTGNPQITFFKVVYRRHTNFALESIQQTFNGAVAYGGRVTSTIARNGDLISRSYLEIKTNDTNLCPYFGLRVIKTAEVEIGGQKIDKHYADWMYIWNELSLPYSKKEGYFKMVGGKGSKKANSFLISKDELGKHLTEKLNITGITQNISVNLELESGGKVLIIFNLKKPSETEGKAIVQVTEIKEATSSITNNLTLSVDMQNTIFTENGAAYTINGGDETPVDVIAVTDNNIVQFSDILQVGTHYNDGTAGSDDDTLSTLYVPLEFWFCRNVGLALPLIALQYHEVKINIHFEEYSLCKRLSDLTTGSLDLQASLWVDYIYLDTDERRKFAQSSHEYLIEQLQFTGKENADAKIRLNLNHPVKELIWVVKKENTNNTNWFNYTDKNTQIVSIDNYESLKTLIGPNSAAQNNVSNCKLILNGNDRFSERDGLYFNLIQPYQHHENIPYNTGINVYSFALKPEEHQPSGTLNMSRIDTSTLSLKYSNGITESTASICVYAVNYNVLRILSGMGGIAYSN
jgi:hypothetical protein